jgi:putative addiction module component (TIGR02574 family)
VAFWQQNAGTEADMTDSRPGVDYTQLTPAQRIVLAQDLWDSVLQRDAAPITTPQQRAEVERRIALADAGQMSSHPWPDVRDELLRNR